MLIISWRIIVTAAHPGGGHVSWDHSFEHLPPSTATKWVLQDIDHWWCYVFHQELRKQACWLNYFLKVRCTVAAIETLYWQPAQQRDSLVPTDFIHIYILIRSWGDLVSNHSLRRKKKKKINCSNTWWRKRKIYCDMRRCYKAWSQKLFLTIELY